MTNPERMLLASLVGLTICAFWIHVEGVGMKLNSTISSKSVDELCQVHDVLRVEKEK